MLIQELIEIFRDSPAIFITSTAFLALLVGSFLNVVIVRLPIILNRAWRKECFEFLEIDNPDSTESFGLMFPRSHCPNCKTAIRAIDNIPILSYILLGGKCHQCKQKISIRYPAVEALTAILCAVVAWHFGVTWQAVAGCTLTCILIAQSSIDLEHTIIPDELTLPTLWLGLLLSLLPVFNDSTSCIIGVVAGYLSLWVIYWVFYLCTGKDGMGQGDFKLLAMLGAWLGWQSLPFIILFSSILGAIIGLGFLLVTKNDRNTRIPFGPFLALSGWIFLLFGSSINDWYLNYSGIF